MDLELVVGLAMIRLGSWMARAHPVVGVALLLLTALVVGPLLFIPGVAGWYDAAIDRAEREIGDDLDAAA